MKIELVIINETNAKVPDKNEISRAILDVLKEKKFDCDIEAGLKVVGKDEIQKLNKKYRNLDKPTDVLSFPIYDKLPKKSDKPVLLGDIIICPECATQDFLFLVKHSVKHLLGYHHA